MAAGTLARPVVARIGFRGRVSGAPVSAQEVWLVRFKDGKCVEYRECETRERALAIAGSRPGR